MRKIFLVMITALSLAVVAGRESVVRGGDQESAADPGSDAAQPKSAVSPRGKIDLAHATARLEPEEVRREYRLSLAETLGHVHAAGDRTDANILDAAARGTRDGLHLALNIAAMLI